MLVCEIAEVLGQLDIAVIVKTPGAAGMVHEMTMFVLLVRATPRNPAGVAMRPP